MFWKVKLLQQHVRNNKTTNILIMNKHVQEYNSPSKYQNLNISQPNLLTSVQHPKLNIWPDFFMICFISLGQFTTWICFRYVFQWSNLTSSILWITYHISRRSGAWEPSDVSSATRVRAFALHVVALALHVAGAVPLFQVSIKTNDRTMYNL